MTQILRNWLQAGSYWPVVVGFFLILVVASGAVAANPVWSHRILSSAATVSDHIVRAAYRPTDPIDSDAGDYLAGLAKAVPGLVQH
jgi:hypothetical protein